ncbi:MAG TPA: putative metallopeptidase, partial [Rhodanobacteraceae bacterium]|nr:putative metallopeptidase [Rhodanobacteraceae bacterium]
LLRLPDFQHLVDGEATIDFIFRTTELITGERRVLGTMCMPRVDGRLSKLFDWLLEDKLGRWPDFLMILDHAYWFDEATPREREILVFHELCHAVHAKDRFGAERFTRDGAPIWGIRAHDIEEFNAVVARYGVWKDDIRAFLDAAGEHRDDMMTPGAEGRRAPPPLN